MTGDLPKTRRRDWTEIGIRRALLSGLSLAPLLGAALIRGDAPQGGDPIARVRGVALKYEPRQGYLRSLLAALAIDPASQVLVFSKTSRQSGFIGPRTPRAIYFNRDAYVGWIPGAPLIEIVAVDPLKGPVFYTLRNERTAAPAFRSETVECLGCHGAAHAPLFALSSRVDSKGQPGDFDPSYDVTPALPLQLRWGGWYVTGTHGAQRHMGNAISTSKDESVANLECGANVTDLRRFFDVRRYLAPHSDIVALMAFEAQMDVQNAIDRAAERLRAGGDVADCSEPLVESLLGCGEERLTAPVKGTSEFAAHSPATAPRDRRGRSLGELDLSTRLRRYPCSPLIYSPSFDALPPAARAWIGRRLSAVLTRKDTDPTFAHLSATDRKAVLEILRDTKPGLIP